MIYDRVFFWGGGKRVVVTNWVLLCLFPIVKMSQSCMEFIAYDSEKSNLSALNVLKQAKFLPEVIKQLEQQPQSVIDDLTELRRICK